MERLRTNALAQAQSLGQALTQLETFREKGNAQLFAQSLLVVQRYEVLSSSLYAVRSVLPERDPFRQRLEETVSDFGLRLGLLQPEKTETVPFSERYRRAWREHVSLFVFTAVFFLASVVVGWQVAMTDPTSVSLFVSQATLEQVLDKNRWFDSLQQNQILGGLQIAINNIKVSIYACALGAMAAVGGLWVLATNGLMLGGLMGFCYRNDFQKELLGFIVGHGPLELTIIVCSGFTGLLIGRVFYLRPLRLFSERIRLAAADAGVILAGVLPWLVLAAIVEAGISPWPFLSDRFKLQLGATIALAFWLFTLWPPKSGPNSASRRKAS